jgi:hypothetical protein
VCADPEARTPLGNFPITLFINMHISLNKQPVLRRRGRQIVRSTLTKGIPKNKKKNYYSYPLIFPDFTFENSRSPYLGVGGNFNVLLYFF